MLLGSRIYVRFLLAASFKPVQFQVERVIMFGRVYISLLVLIHLWKARCMALLFDFIFLCIDKFCKKNLIV